jgi:predicted phosphohydrolase
MTKLHIMSDLHLELSDFTIPEVQADILILAGDIGISIKDFDPVLESASRYEYVLMVAGNYEYHKGGVDQGSTTHLLNLFKDTNIKLLNNTWFTYKDIRFVGATLWTDFDNKDELKMKAAKLCMSEFGGLVSYHGKDLCPQDTTLFHEHSKLVLGYSDHDESDKKQIAITHHMPSKKLLPDKHKDSILNAAFASDCEDLMKTKDMWICGDANSVADIEIEGCRTIINPRGYPGEDTGFNPKLVVEI